MKSFISYSLFLIFLFVAIPPASSQNKLKFDGQLSAWGNYSPDNELDIMLGGRYLPELSYGFGKVDTQYVDFEVSANIYGNTQFHPFDTAANDGGIQPYRAWARFTTQQFELRVGLQKINFGSATVLRPLMWFDQIDPRDPLQLTNGVYGVLARYYFLNNANIWLWGLYLNEEQKGWEQIQTNKNIPEFGGRYQQPLKQGELAFSYHHRTADSRHLGIDSLSFDKIPENRIGLDGKWDVLVGLWFEASWIHKQKNIGQLTNQTQFNIGTDYTFGVGNGLNVVVEQLITSFDEKAFDFKKPSNLTAATVSYPLGLFDNISTVFYYDWSGKSLFTFVNWSKQFPKITMNVMGYWNTTNTQVIRQNSGANSFNGKGIQIMLVYNH